MSVLPLSDASGKLPFFLSALEPKSAISLMDTTHLTTTGYGACMKERKATRRMLRKGSSKVPFL